MPNLLREDSIFAVVAEDVEGVLQEPAADDDGYVQLKRDGVSLKSARDLKERGVFTGTLTDADPRLGMRNGSGAFSAEMKASGLEGEDPDYAIMIESLFPDRHAIAARIATKNAGNTGTNLKIQDADIAALKKGDIIVVLQDGAYHPCAITAVDETGGAANVTVFPGLTVGNFANSVEIAKSVTFKPADAGHKSYSALAYWGSGGPGVLEAVTGARTKTMTLEKFDTGELPSFKFDFEGMSYVHDKEHDAPHDPEFDDSLPAVVLSCGLYKNGVALDTKAVSFSIEQPLAFLKSVISQSGKITGRASGTRKVKGKISPYADGDSIQNFSDWEEGTAFSQFGYIALPDAVNGLQLGSIVAWWMPNCVITQPEYNQEEGVMTEDLEFQATGGPRGTEDEISIGFC